jgi:hypothetical protein
VAGGAAGERAIIRGQGGPRRRRTSRRTARPAGAPWWRGLTRFLVEVAALATIGVVGALVALGALAGRTPRPSGSIGLLAIGGAVVALAALLIGLLAIGGAVVALAALLAGGGWLWWQFRRRATRIWPLLPLACAGVAAGAAVWLLRQPTVEREVASLREVVSSAAEAERETVAHQVYAAYRRADLDEMKTVLERARVFEGTIYEASVIFGVEPEVLVGIGCAESGFYPRDSADGGRGVFQITVPPATAVSLARERLKVSKLDPLNQRHNAFVAAATLRRYLEEMRGDLFLGLLAYNIGPRNGGLRSIMEQYGARDFVTIQPYLQRLPRDYPIRVLSAALAYRLWRKEGRLPRYEEGDNARWIQTTGIPGLRGEAQPTPQKDVTRAKR